MNGIFSLVGNDFVKSIATAIFVAVLFVLVGAVSAQGFDVFSADYNALFHSSVNVAVITFFGELGRRFLTTKQGSVLAITPNDKPPARD